MDLVVLCLALTTVLVFFASTSCLAFNTCSANDIRTAVLLNRETQMDLREHKLEMKQQLNKLRAEIRQKESEIDDLRTQLNNLTDSVRPDLLVYFLVHSPLNLTVSDGGNVRYGTIMYSVGGGNYDNNTGKYTVPYTGLYAFSHQICSKSSAHHYFSIVREGERILPTEVFNAAAHVTCTSASAYVKVAANEKVWIQSLGSLNLANSGDYRTSFSGALIHKL